MNLLLHAAEPVRPGCIRRLRTVFSYDIASPRRARHVRRALAGWCIDAQYSVVESMLLGRERYELAGDLRELLDVEEDSLLLWTPQGARRWRWLEGALVQDRCDESAAAPVADGARCGNFVIAYDVRDEVRLRRLHKAIRGDTLALQRSVYWLRGDQAEALHLAAHLGKLLESEDWLWIYPLARAGDLWFVLGGRPPLLPTGQMPAF